MQCTLYSSDGPLMSEGTCEVADGVIQMVTQQWHMTPTVGGLPLMVVMADQQRYEVRVTDVQVLRSDPSTGPTEVYQLTPLDGARS